VQSTAADVTGCFVRTALQVLPLVIGALEHNAKHHWNPAVHRCEAQTAAG